MCVFWIFFFRRSRLRLRLLLLVAVHRSLAADQLDLAVLFPQVGHRVAVQDGVEPQVRAQQRHVPAVGESEKVVNLFNRFTITKKNVSFIIT